LEWELPFPTLYVGLIGRPTNSQHFDIFRPLVIRYTCGPANFLSRTRLILIQDPQNFENPGPDPTRTRKILEFLDPTQTRQILEI